MKREGIGIKKIDEMVQGGFPKGSVIGISGPPGVGKSIFALHFILEGARSGQKGVYVCLEEPRKNVDNTIKGFSFADEFYEFEKKGLIVIKCFNYSEYEKITLELLEKIYDDKKIERVVVDSFNCFFIVCYFLFNTSFNFWINHSNFFRHRRNPFFIFIFSYPSIMNRKHIRSAINS